MKHAMLFTVICLTYGVDMSAVKSSLKAYRTKRKFNQTPEPAGKIKKKKSKAPIFVIQEHHARSHHHDFRIEEGGTLLSWAVPKGVPKKIGVKRLAVQTENHPMEYALFEGVIPEGNYGAGTVEIVDSGTYENIKIHDGQLVSMSDAVKNGAIEICLQGKKFTGCYALIHARLKNEKDWLLMRIKKKPARKTKQKNGEPSKTKRARKGKRT